MNKVGFKGSPNATYVDMSSPEIVQIQIGPSGKTVWINVDGQCRFRASRIGRVVVDDLRMPAGKPDLI